MKLIFQNNVRNFPESLKWFPKQNTRNMNKSPFLHEAAFPGRALFSVYSLNEFYLKNQQKTEQ